VYLVTNDWLIQDPPCGGRADAYIPFGAIILIK
jgi:hypothetical protein